MDTRTKIIPLDQALAFLATEQFTAVQMDCDPLLAPVLANLRGPLLAFVSERENAYLSTDARAQLAASLGCVQYVSIGEVAGIKDLRPEEDAARHALEQLVLRKSEAS